MNVSADRDELDLLTIGETMALVTPAPGGLLQRDAQLTLTSGGAESNVAIGAAARGIRVAWYSRLGADPLGDLVRESIASRGVDTSTVRTDDTRQTGLMLKQPAPTRSRVFYYRAGSAASAMGPSDLHSLPASRVVHVSGITAALSDSCQNLLHRILDGAVAPAVVSFDVNYRPALWNSSARAADVLLELAKQAHVVFVGRDEAETLWGAPRADDIRRLLPHVPHLIVKDGAIEAVEYADTTTVRVPAHTVEVIEPVGAGDAFAAGWLSAWLRNVDPAGRLQSGHDGAAAALRTHHDQPGYAPAPTPLPGAADRPQKRISQ